MQSFREIVPFFKFNAHPILNYFKGSIASEIYGCLKTGGDFL